MNALKITKITTSTHLIFLWTHLDNDLCELLAVCKKITQTVPKAYFPQLFDELINAVDNQEVWYEHDDNPKANGWVDYKGRP